MTSKIPTKYFVGNIENVDEDLSNYKTVSFQDVKATNCTFKNFDGESIRIFGNTSFYNCTIKDIKTSNMEEDGKIIFTFCKIKNVEVEECRGNISMIDSDISNIDISYLINSSVKFSIERIRAKNITIVYDQIDISVDSLIGENIKITGGNIFLKSNKSSVKNLTINSIYVYIVFLRTIVNFFFLTSSLLNFPQLFFSENSSICNFLFENININIKSTFIKNMISNENTSSILGKEGREIFSEGDKNIIFNSIFMRACEIIFMTGKKITLINCFKDGIIIDSLDPPNKIKLILIENYISIKEDILLLLNKFGIDEIQKERILERIEKNKTKTEFIWSRSSDKSKNIDIVLINNDKNISIDGSNTYNKISIIKNDKRLIKNPPTITFTNSCRKIELKNIIDFKLRINSPEIYEITINNSLLESFYTVSSKITTVYLKNSSVNLIDIDGSNIQFFVAENTSIRTINVHNDIVKNPPIKWSSMKNSWIKFLFSFPFSKLKIFSYPNSIPVDNDKYEKLLDWLEINIFKRRFVNKDKEK